MIQQYFVQIRNRNNTNFLTSYGNIIHIAKLTGLIIFETTEESAIQLSKHPEVISIEISGNFSLAANF